MDKKAQSSLLHMFTQPVKQLEGIKSVPVFGQALMTLIILYLVGNWLTTLGIDIQIVEEMNGIPQEVVVIIMTIITFLKALFVPVIGVIILSLIYYLCAKAVKGHVSFQQLISLNTHVFIIAGVGSVVNGLLIAIFGGNIEYTQHVYTSIGGLTHAEGMSGILLGKIEAFTIWMVIISAIGLQIVVGFSRKMAWMIAITVYTLNIMVTWLFNYVIQMIG